MFIIRDIKPPSINRRIEKKRTRADINDFPLYMGFGRMKCMRRIWFKTNCDAKYGMEALRS